VQRKQEMGYIKVIFIALTLLFGNTAQAANQLVFSSGYFFLFDKSKEIVSQIYKRLGYDIIIDIYPAKRALKMSNSGLVDGELFRIKGLQQTYPNLRMVPTPLYELDALAISINLAVEVNNWQDLQPYKIGIMSGAEYAKKGAKGMDTHPANNYKELFNMLERKRVDVIVCIKPACLFELKKLKINNINVLGVVERMFVYHYLHRKHEKLVPLVDEQIIQMHKEGIIEKIVKQD